MYRIVLCKSIAWMQKERESFCSNIYFRILPYSITGQYNHYSYIFTISGIVTTIHRLILNGKGIENVKIQHWGLKDSHRIFVFHFSKFPLETLDVYVCVLLSASTICIISNLNFCFEIIRVHWRNKDFTSVLMFLSWKFEFPIIELICIEQLPIFGSVRVRMCFGEVEVEVKERVCIFYYYSFE